MQQSTITVKPLISVAPIPQTEIFLSRLVAVFAQSIDAMC